MTETWVPESCTLPTEQVPLRLAEFDDLFADVLLGVERRGPERLRLTLAARAEATLSRARDLIDRESACCSFFTFGVGRGDDGNITVDIAVPAGREAVLDGVERQAGGHRVRR